MNLIRHTKEKLVLTLVACGAFFAPVGTSIAQLVYYEDFDTDVSANWVVNSVGGSNPVDFYFDYSAIGIPPAPHSSGTTRGLKMLANIDPDAPASPSGASVSPIGFGITDNFDMHWDMWANFIGPMPDGASGSTQ